MKSILLYAEFSVLIVALGLSSLALLLLSHQIHWPIAGFAGLVAFFFYTLERNLTRTSPQESAFPKKTLWLLENKALNAVFLAVSALLSLLLGFSLSLSALMGFMLVGLLALSYSIVKFPRKSGQASGLKRSPYLKPALMVLVWVYLTFWLPWLSAGRPKHEGLWMLALLWSLWILSNSLLFDIRDIRLDRPKQTLSPAAKLGRLKAHRLINLLIGLQLLVSFGYASLHGSILKGIVLSSSSLAFYLCNRYLQRKPNASIGFYHLADLTLTLPLGILGGVKLLY